MNPTIVAAYVSGGFAVTGPILTYFITKAYERRFLEPIGRNRGEALNGNWQGTIVQSTLIADVDIRLHAKNKEIVGEAHLRVQFDGVAHAITLAVTGGFLYDKFLKLDYKNTNRGTIQFGTMVLELAPHPSTMEGQYVGYGSLTESIVSGQILLTKKPA